MRTQHLENVLRFLELFTNNCENRTQKYTAHDCILQVKKYCTTCYAAIQCLAKYKNELTQLYKWNVLTYYSLLYYYDFIESATILLKYRLKHPLCSSDTDNFSDLKRESRQLSYFSALKDSSVLYHIKALKEESSVLYHVKAPKCHTYIRGARLKSKINSVYGEKVSERPEKQGGGISESAVNLFRKEAIILAIREYLFRLAVDYSTYVCGDDFYADLDLFTQDVPKMWHDFPNKEHHYEFWVSTIDGTPCIHKKGYMAVLFAVLGYSIESMSTMDVNIDVRYLKDGKMLVCTSLEQYDLVTIKKIYDSIVSERSEREVKEVEHYDSY